MQKATTYAERIYIMTRHFPAEERFGMTLQLRRAAVFISSNIAEGTSRASRVDNARFVEIASGSLFETVSQAMLSQRLGFLSSDELVEIYQLAGDQSRMLSGLRTYLLDKHTAT